MDNGEGAGRSEFLWLHRVMQTLTFCRCDGSWHGGEHLQQKKIVGISLRVIEPQRERERGKTLEKNNLSFLAFSHPENI